MIFRSPVHGRVLPAPAMPSSQGPRCLLDAVTVSRIASVCENRVLVRWYSILPVEQCC